MGGRLVEKKLLADLGGMGLVGSIEELLVHRGGGSEYSDLCLDQERMLIEEVESSHWQVRVLGSHLGREVVGVLVPVD